MKSDLALHRPYQRCDSFAVNGIGQFAAGLERAADNEAVRRAEIADIFARNPAAQQNLCLRAGPADSSDVLNIGRQAGAGAGNNQGIRQAALDSVARRVFNGPVTQRHRVFDVNIRKDTGPGTNPLPIPQSFVGVALDQSLVRQHGSGVDIDANKTSCARGAQSERRASVVAEHVEPDRQLHRLPDGAARRRHRRDGFRRRMAFREGHVAKVFDEHRVRTAVLVRAGVVHGKLDQRL